MTTIQISGTFAELQQKFQELALPSDRMFHFIIREHEAESLLTGEKETSPNANPEEYFQRLQIENARCRAMEEQAARMRLYDEEFANVPRVHGILQVPIPGPLTIDQIKELSEDQP